MHCIHHDSIYHCKARLQFHFSSVCTRLKITLSFLKNRFLDCTWLDEAREAEKAMLFRFQYFFFFFLLFFFSFCPAAAQISAAQDICVSLSIRGHDRPNKVDESKKTKDPD